MAKSPAPQTPSGPHPVKDTEMLVLFLGDHQPAVGPKVVKK
jgi:hypothetical protein